MNSGNTIGVGKYISEQPSVLLRSSSKLLTDVGVDVVLSGFGQYAIRNGSREDAANTYLEPAASSLQNLDVLINTQVTRVLQTSEDGGVPVFKGVQFAQSASSESFVGLFSEH